MSRYFDYIFTLLIFVLLALIVYPSLHNPPLSDDWHLFYFFQNLDNLPGQLKWLHVLNYDPFEQMRFQPLSRIFYYILHLAFGAEFIFFRIANFLLYFLSVILLYRFSLNFSRNKLSAAFFTGFFSLLFSHFDIVVWVHHIYIIAAVVLFLLGFMAYLRFMKKASFFELTLMICLFLAGAWCYEPFVLWPFSILFLYSLKRYKVQGFPDKKRVLLLTWVSLILIYIIYLYFYIFTRTLGTYFQPRFELLDLLKPGFIIPSALLTFFNLIYNGILINIFPILAFPLIVTENIYMNGAVISYIESGGRWLVYVVGMATGISLIVAMCSFYKKKLYEEIKIVGFFLFLLFSVVFLLFLCRQSTNSFAYGLTEFRYQYINNLILTLLVIFIAELFYKKIRKFISFASIFFMASLLLNIACDTQLLSINKQHGSDLRVILENIKKGIQNGTIKESKKVYLDDDINKYLPSLCWNIEMGRRFMNGSYHWMFSRRELSCFANDLKEAAWVIDKDTLGLVNKTDMRTSFNRVKISIGKDSQYLNLGHYYREQGSWAQAEKVFKEAITENPKNFDAFNGLGDCYRDQGRDDDAQEFYAIARKIQYENK